MRSAIFSAAILLWPVTGISSAASGIVIALLVIFFVMDVIELGKKS